MSYSGISPESLLGRSDSKNPTTTCRGLNQNGRPCRRDIKITTAPSRARSNSNRSKGDSGDLLAVLSSGDATVFFCWQHKDQAGNFTARLRHQAKTLSLAQKSSIDTLVERLGIMDLGEYRDIDSPSKQSRPQHHNGGKRSMMLPTKSQYASPLSAQRTLIQQTHSSLDRQIQFRSRTQSKPKTSWCCFVSTVEDYDGSPPARQRSSRPMQHSQTESPRQPRTPLYKKSLSQPSMTQTSSRAPQMPQTPQTSSRRPLDKMPHTSCQSPNQTQTLLSYIPPHLPPQTAAALLAELSKPLSPHDEAGYIYVFWLTPQSPSHPPNPEAVSSLFSSTLSPQSKTTITPPKILLKIGRAVNVHRRMTQWTKQCGHHLTLIRHYPQSQPISPYHPPISRQSRSSTSSEKKQTHNDGDDDETKNLSVPTGKAPYIHRIERLIHLELAALKYQNPSSPGSKLENENDEEKNTASCKNCGRVHREWFEIDGTKEAVRVVDRVIQRWISWGLTRRQMLEQLEQLE